MHGRLDIEMQIPFSCMHRRLASAALLCYNCTWLRQVGPSGRRSHQASCSRLDASDSALWLKTAALTQMLQGDLHRVNTAAAVRTRRHALVEDGDEDVQGLPDQRLAHLRLARPQQVHEHLGGSTQMPVSGLVSCPYPPGSHCNSGIMTRRILGLADWLSDYVCAKSETSFVACGCDE